MPTVLSEPFRDGRRVPWHEDSAYWKDVLEPMAVCTVWLAIDPSTRTPTRYCSQGQPLTPQLLAERLNPS